MLTAKNISYKTEGKLLLDDVTINCEAGKLNIIIGPNGAGKSTLVKVLCNQIQPSAGTVHYGTKNITTFSIAALAKFRSVLSQNIELAFPLKVAEVVMMGRYPHFTGKPGSKDEAASEEAMRFFDLLDLSERNYMTLSGGEKQRVHFARVTSQIWYPNEENCRYLFLDEPLTFLDVYYQFQFMNQVMELLKQKDIVVIGVVHDLNLAAKFADNIILLHNAQLLASGSKKEVLTKENIKTAYRIEPTIIEQKEQNRMYLFFD